MTPARQPVSKFRCPHGFPRDLAPCFECGDYVRSDFTGRRADKKHLRVCQKCGAFVDVESLGPGRKCLRGCNSPSGKDHYNPAAWRMGTP